jgi:hypothetical protein
VEVPETILKWSRQARQYENDQRVSESELGEIMAHFCHLQALLRASEEHSDPSKFASLALSVDSELAEWSSRWQMVGLYATITVEESTADVFSNYWHLYPGFIIATTWNHSRCLRIMLNQIIIDQLLRMTTNLDADLVYQYSTIYHEQIETCKRIIVELSQKICASVPYYLGDHPVDESNPGKSSDERASEEARVKQILWPLYIAGQNEYVPEIMRTWIIDRIEILSEGLGTHRMEGKALAVLLKSRQLCRGEAWRDLGRADSFASDVSEENSAIDDF